MSIISDEQPTHITCVMRQISNSYGGEEMFLKEHNMDPKKYQEQKKIWEGQLHDWYFAKLKKEGRNPLDHYFNK